MARVIPARLRLLAERGRPRLSWGTRLGGRMAIIEDYAAIAKRLRELQPVSSQTSQEIDQDKWRNLAEQTARDWVQSRRGSDLVRRVITSRKIRGAWKR